VSGLRITYEGVTYSFELGEVVTIGRNPDSGVVVGDPTVSRKHAYAVSGADGWVLHDVGADRVFVDGRPAKQVTIGSMTQVRLVSEEGPLLYCQANPAAAAPDPAPYAPQAYAPPAPDYATPAAQDYAPAAPDYAPAAPDYAAPAPQAYGPPAAPDYAAPAPAEYAPAAPAPVSPASPAGAAPPPAAPLYTPASPESPVTPPESPAPSPMMAQQQPVAPPPPHIVPGMLAPAAGPGYPAAPQHAMPQHAMGMPAGGMPAGGMPPGGMPPGGMPIAVGIVAEPHPPGFAAAIHILVPVRSWLTDPGWRQGFRLLVIVYGLLPSVFFVVLSNSTNVTAPGWAYSLYIAPLWAIAFYLLIRPGPVTRQVIGVAVGIVVGTLVLVPILTLPWEKTLYTTKNPHSLLPWIFGVGYAEEITKALPVLVAALVLLRWRKVKLDVRMWMFLGTIGGLAFGVAESAKYVGLYLSAGNQEQGVAIQVILSFAVRVFLDGFQHAVWAGISAFFIGMGVNYRRRRIPLIIFGISLPAFLHGLNDWAASLSNQWLWIAVGALSLIFFMGYTMSAASIQQQVRDTPMFRGDSMLMSRAFMMQQPPPGSGQGGAHGGAHRGG
jgi:RsiW-degrading membrane proteinase PrsW (M82 family)